MANYQSNTAYDYEMFAPKQNTVPIPAAPHKRARITTLPVKKNKAKAKNGTLVMFSRLTVAGLIVFMLCFNIYVRTEINDVKQEISKADSQLEVLDSENIRLEMAVENKISYKNLEQAAQDLGMQKKSRGQMRYIDTSSDDTAEILEAGR